MGPTKESKQFSLKTMKYVFEACLAGAKAAACRNLGTIKWMIFISSESMPLLLEWAKFEFCVSV